MADRGKDSGLGDDQGTRIGAPDPVRPASHADSPPDRPARATGAGSEATTATDGSSVEGHDRQHRSGYGGKGGAPDTSSDGRSV
jgi:hypothetical protein